MLFNRLEKSVTAFKYWISLGVLSALSGCTVSISEAEVFQPKQENRRPAGSELRLDGEDQLPNGVSITHERLAANAADLAITFANSNSARLIVHCYGNASDRKSSGVRRIRELQPYANVLLFDYPGYGDSEGMPTADQLEDATKTIARYAAAHGARQIITWGQSMGGFICARVAHHLGAKLDAAVFETTAQNAQVVAQSWKPWYAGPFVRISISDGLGAFDNVQALSGFTGPVLVLGAGKDESLHVSLSRKLANNLRDAGINIQYQEFDHATHMNVPQQPDFDTVVTDFLAKLDAGKNQRPSD